jgi:hypothetical protein
MQLGLTDVTVYVASMYPCCGRKNSCTPRRACSSVRLCGSAGSDGAPFSVDVNVFVFGLKYTVDVTSLPELARRGVL